MSDERLKVARDGRVLVLTIDDPETRNATDMDLNHAGMEAVYDADTDAGVGAIVLRGAGGVFSSGGNLNKLKRRGEMSNAQRRASVNTMNGWVKAMRLNSKPVIAAVEGFAAGAGLSIALGADLVVAARDARFVMAHIKVGLNPDGGASALIGRGLPHQFLAEMLMTGSAVSAERMHALGLVNRVVEPGAADDEAMTLARRLADGPAAALARVKKLIEGAQVNNLQAQLDLEADLVEAALDHAEAAEGISAFLEKRKPDFRRDKT